MKSEHSRWLSKVVVTEDRCWTWVGSSYRGGYGHFRRKIGGKWIMGKAHRYSYEYYNKITQESMKGFFVCHKCDNPKCVNPDHLFLGSCLDNTQDKINKGRHAFGCKEGHRKLSFLLAEEMRACKQKNPNLLYSQIAKLFNTSVQQVHRVLTNKIWIRK